MLKKDDGGDGNGSGDGHDGGGGGGDGNGGGEGGSGDHHDDDRDNRDHHDDDHDNRDHHDDDHGNDGDRYYYDNNYYYDDDYYNGQYVSTSMPQFRLFSLCPSRLTHPSFSDEILVLSAFPILAMKLPSTIMAINAWMKFLEQSKMNLMQTFTLIATAVGCASSYPRTKLAAAI